MKFYSETLNKLYDSEKELKAAEKAFNDQNLQKENTKKELSTKIEVAEVALDEAHKNYEAVREEAAKLMDESNKQIIKMMNDAKAKITEAEKARTDAIVAFNQQFGTYRANYTGERAKRESDRINKIVNDIFSWPFTF
jgi:sugar-specific transcriptional regulator TrmB